MTEDWGMVHTIFTMAAPILKINVETNTQIDFDHIDSIKNHPMAGNFMVSLPEIIEMTLGDSISTTVGPYFTNIRDHMGPPQSVRMGSILCSAYRQNFDRFH